MTVETFEPLFAEAWMPERPRAMPAKQGPAWRMPREAALGFPYIETNATGVFQNLVVTDRDWADTDHAPSLLGLPPPSWVSTNAHTTAGHIAYALKHGVCLTDAARRPPVNLLARIEHGLVDVLDGDPGYTGTFTKNPTHHQHPTLWGPPEARYSLRELASALDALGALPTARNPRKHVTRSGIGRNCDLFDTTRHWGYEAIRRFWGGPLADWHQAVFTYAWQHNETVIANDFTTGPLSATEVSYLAASVTHWIWHRFTPDRYTEIQSDRGKKSGQARREQAEQLWSTV